MNPSDTKTHSVRHFDLYAHKCWTVSGRNFLPFAVFNQSLRYMKINNSLINLSLISLMNDWLDFKILTISQFHQVRHQNSSKAAKIFMRWLMFEYFMLSYKGDLQPYRENVIWFLSIIVIRWGEMKVVISVRHQNRGFEIHPGVLVAFTQCHHRMSTWH